MDRVVEGNSKLAASTSLAEIGGPGLAGGLVQVIGAPFAIFVDALSYLVSAATLNGSSLAAGHPFAATGGRIVANLAKLLAQKGSGRGVISICAAGGQGVTAILERS